MRPTTQLLATVALAAAACARGQEAPDVAWNDWLAEAEVWDLATAEPNRLPAPATTAEPLLRVKPPARRPDRLGGRFVCYEAPLSDHAAHAAFAARGIEGELVAIPVKPGGQADSTLEKYATRAAAFFVGDEATPGPDEVRVVRYEAPVDDIALHAELAHLPGQIVRPGMLRLPEVRFFQPKARVYSDLKRSNDEQFDLFSDGSLLASLDVVELYFPTPFLSERLGRIVGRRSQLSRLGWRVGTTFGLGIATALTEGDSQASGAAVTTASAGFRYEFPLGRPSDEVLATGDWRLDQRTRVGLEVGVQAGLSTDESIDDGADAGLYFGILVNTPWGG